MATANRDVVDRRRERSRNRSRRQYSDRLALARRGRRRCPKKLGVGTCNGLLEDRVLPGGRAVVVCDHCERKRQGLCRKCPTPVQGRAIFCPSCRLVRRRQAHQKFRDENRALIRAQARARAVVYRQLHGAAIKERARQARKYCHQTPACRRCGEAIDWARRGRPRLDCVACRPGRVA